MSDITTVPFDYIVIHKKTENIVSQDAHGDYVCDIETEYIPLVRCKECRYCVNGQCWKTDGLDKLDGNVSGDDFCSRGERKESE